MRTHTLIAALLLACLPTGSSVAAPWGKPVSPAVHDASGYVVIPNAVVMPQRTHVYRAVFDATRGADKSTDLIPALDMAGSELNLLVATGMPAASAKFVVVFHGAGIDGILRDADYRAKFGVPNPNLRAIAEMRKLGVELYACGQNLAFANIAPETLTPDVKVASDALIVLMTYQNNGYALLSY